MYGRRAKDDRAQLALLDAMVFFAIAMFVSSVLVGQVRSVSGDERGVDGSLGTYAANALQVVMASSVGEDMTVHAPMELKIRSEETVCVCLSAELRALQSGVDPKVFACLNDAIAAILDAVCPPSIRAHLVAYAADGGMEEPLLSIPSHSQLGTLAYASSVEMPCSDGMVCLVMLVLEPAFPSELMEV